jgi:hypothetical protein
LAAHRAKRAEAAAGGSSGEATPLGAGQSVSTPTTYVSYPYFEGAYTISRTNSSFTGTATSHSLTSTPTAAPGIAHLSPTLRRCCGPRHCPIPTSNRKPSLPVILATWCCSIRPISSCCRALCPRLFASTIPPARRTHGLWSYSTSFPSTTHSSNRHRSPSSTWQPAHTRRPPSTTCVCRASYQRPTDATDAHGPPRPTRTSAWLHQWQRNSDTRPSLVIR